MKYKIFLKKKFGENYKKFYLKNILILIFGKLYFKAKNFKKIIQNKFTFIKINLNKKIEHQSIIKKERGFLLDFTNENYLTFHLRPKNSKNFELESTCNIEEKIAIIIQGPIQDKFEFLKNTLNIYKKVFKNSIIIISTWKSENVELINTLKGENIFIIFSDEPEKAQSNVNHQIYSTNKALNLANEYGAKFSLKTRSDVRINKNNLESFFISLINIFPVKKNNFINSRIVVPSLITFKYRIYSLSDIVMFGETNDLLQYFKNETFSIGLEKFGLNKNNLLKNETPIIAEVFLCSRFIKQIKGEVDWTLNGWWESLKDYFCIIDNSSLDLFWYKYDWHFEYRYLRTYSDKFARAIDFQDWLSLYNNSQNNWDLASGEHEKYDSNFQLQNIFKN